MREIPAPASQINGRSGRSAVSSTTVARVDIPIHAQNREQRHRAAQVA
jgi:hypothetical protein